MEIYYEEYGAGKPLVLLHGFGGCTQNRHPFTSQLSEHYRLIVVDLSGHVYQMLRYGLFQVEITFLFMMPEFRLFQPFCNSLMGRILPANRNAHSKVNFDLIKVSLQHHIQ